MKWNSPGHGRAYAPYAGEPPRWPAVCLDWHDAEKYIAWLNDKVRAAHPTLDHSNGRLSPADRSGMGICRARQARRRRAGGATTSASAKPIATAAAANGTTGSWPTSTASPQPFRALRHARQCLAMDRGLLASELRRRAAGRQRVDRRDLRQACHSWGIVEQSAGVRALSRAQRQRASTAETMTIPVSPGFRVARDLP